jgi:enoyl-CoA hydratase/carnithine racemase
LCDELAEPDQLRERAHALAREFALSAPLAVRAIRNTLRSSLAESVRSATARERLEQDRLLLTNDFREGVRASSERRPPAFRGN